MSSLSLHNGAGATAGPGGAGILVAPTSAGAGSLRSGSGVSFELNHNEYGLSQSAMAHSIDIQFQPSEYGILDHYSVVKEIYRVQLSPTIITLTTHNETNLVSILMLVQILML